MDNKEKLQQLVQDEEFLKEILALETIEEVQQAFKGRDVDISIEDLEKIRELMAKAINNNYELTEEDLEKICGSGSDYEDDIKGYIIEPIVTAFFKVLGTSLGEKFFKGWLFRKLDW